ncbi:MAG: site-specific integrase [Planctomycetota bacterium]|nr:MAG: site-specific integrase [Planctomycetota bacterium]
MGLQRSEVRILSPRPSLPGLQSGLTVSMGGFAQPARRLRPGSATQVSMVTTMVPGHAAMKRRKNGEPPVLKRSNKGGAYAYVGNRQRWFGSYDDPETHKRFGHFLQMWEVNGGQPPPEAEPGPQITCETLVALYLAHCETHYRRPDGRPTGESQQVAYTAKPLLHLYRELPARSFSIHCLKRVRAAMVDSGLSRKTVNQRVWRIRRMFRWAAEEELISPEVLASLAVLRSLQEGRTTAHETDAVTAVSEEHFLAVLPYLRTPVRAMVELQWWTGARPGEVREFRLAYLSRTDESVWLYAPPQHKTRHRAKERWLGIGPKSQEVLRPFLMRVPRPDPDKPLFSPGDAMEERHRLARTRGNGGRKARRDQVGRTKQQFAEQYSRSSYRHAIQRACRAAGIPVWTPHQLRHSAATRVESALGKEQARIVLNHSSLDATEVYLDRDIRQALQVMKELG